MGLGRCFSGVATHIPEHGQTNRLLGEWVQPDVWLRVRHDVGLTSQLEVAKALLSEDCEPRHHRILEQVWPQVKSFGV